MEYLTAYGWQGAVLFAWVALSIGSFLNVVIYRTPVILDREWRSQARELLEIRGADEDFGEPFNLVTPRSRCPHCHHQIKPWENIPVLSWLFLRGKCANCKAPIPFRYPAIELLTAATSIVVITLFGFTWVGMFVCLFTWMLISLTFIDYDTTLLPDQITYPLLWLGLITNTFFNGIVPAADALAGAVAGYLFLWGTYWAFKLVTGKEGMGYGDFKLLAALGAWLGWQALPSIILIAAASGLTYAVGRILLARQQSSEPIPFGPFLAIAGWVTLVFRDNVLAILLP
jgi:leader peptidase (prepilin peptidase)/N-methyltransferase